MGGGPEGRTQHMGGVAAELVQVLLQLPLGVTPGVVGVGLLEADHAQSAHHGGLSESLG